MTTYRIRRPRVLAVLLVALACILVGCSLSTTTPAATSSTGTRPSSGAPSSPHWSAPSDIDASNSLAAVSCPSASFLVAVDLRNAITYKGTA